MPIGSAGFVLTPSKKTEYSLTNEYRVRTILLIFANNEAFMTTHGADLLIEAIDAKANPCVVGLDPRVSQLPDEIRQSALSEFGNTIEGTAKAIELFCIEVINQVKDLVGIVKPQIAFFEQYGSLGIAAFERVVHHAHNENLIVITDAKRNDIGSTCEAYARAHLGTVELIGDPTKGTVEKNRTTTPHRCDWLTVSPYLGSDGIDPFIEVIQDHPQGIFILVKTSNPSAGEFQDIITGRGEPLWQSVASMVKSKGGEHLGTRGYSTIGAVVAATYPDEAKALRQLMPRTIFLVPGYGAQGGHADSIVDTFQRDGYGAVINASRSILYAFRNAPSTDPWTKAIRNATVAMRDDVLSSLKKHGKLPAQW